MEEAYEPLQHEEGEIPRALSAEEQEHFLTVASREQRWHVIYCYTLVVLNTTASSYEMRGLRMGDVTRGDAMIYVRWGKNRYRVRSVPLLEDGAWALGELIERARALGARDPQHHLFPLRLRTNVWDPTRPVSDWGLVKPWNEVRSAAGFPWFQMNALRHTALTRYAEAGTPIEILQSYAGHISEKMTRHYVQIGETAKRRYALMAAQKNRSQLGVPRRLRPLRPPGSPPTVLKTFATES
jgi:integrase